MIRYTEGDATDPVCEPSETARVICHVCNNLGAWGAGFVLAISKRWREPEMLYLSQAHHLGSVQLVAVEPGLFVANMIAQDGFPRAGHRCALDFTALATCFARLLELVGADWSFHMPRIGCGIGGARWPQVEPVIEQMLGRRNVVVYDLGGAK